MYHLSNQLKHSLQPVVFRVISDNHNARVDPSFSLDDTQIFSFSKNETVQTWGVEQWEPMSGPPWKSPGGSPKFIPSRVSKSVLSPDGQHIVSGFYDGALSLFRTEGLGGKPDDAEAATQVEKRLGQHNHVVATVAFSLDGNYVVSGSYDGTVRIWDVKKRIQVGGPLQHNDYVRSVGFSPDGERVVSGTDDGTVRIWNVKAGTQVGELRGHTNWVRSVAFSRDSRRIVSCADDKTVRIWDAEAMKQVGEFRGHIDYIISVAFSRDGKRVVSGGEDETVRIWDVEAGTQLGQPLQGHTNGVTFVAFSPDGMCVIAGSDDGTLRVWDIKEHIRRESFATKPKKTKRRKEWAEGFSTSEVPLQSDPPVGIHTS